MAKTTKWNKHLSDKDRMDIQEFIVQGISLKEIAAILQKDPSTISKEVKKRRRSTPGNTFGKSPCSLCAKVSVCDIKGLCNNECGSRCRNCRGALQLCPEYQEAICDRLLRFPWVCNGCDKKARCRRPKQIYIATQAHAGYRETLVASREGINLTVEKLDELDAIVSPRLKKGQSINNIINTTDEITCSGRTIYNYVQLGVFSARRIDLRRATKMKPRATKRVRNKDALKCREGRTYNEYAVYLADHPASNVVQMDTVEGTKGGRSLLTLHFPRSRFMLAFLLLDKTADAIVEIFDYLEERLGTEQFRGLFEIVLTDRGTEFADAEGIERSLLKEGKRTRLFYCDSYSSWQKGAIERNHELIRFVLPKGSSFDGLTQSQVNLLMSHINSYARERIDWKSPIEEFEEIHGRGIIPSLNIKKISVNDILLTHQLLA